MSANKNPDPSTTDAAPESDQTKEAQRGGSGAASALERMKADHALRHRHRHGVHASGPGHEDDRTPQR